MVSNPGEGSNDFKFLVPGGVLLDFIVQVIINGFDLNIQNSDNLLYPVFNLGNCGSILSVINNCRNN